MKDKDVLYFEEDDKSELGVNGKQVFVTKRINGKTEHNKKSKEKKKEEEKEELKDNEIIIDLPYISRTSNKNSKKQTSNETSNIQKNKENIKSKKKKSEVNHEKNLSKNTKKMEEKKAKKKKEEEHKKNLKEQQKKRKEQIKEDKIRKKSEKNYKKIVKKQQKERKRKDKIKKKNKENKKKNKETAIQNDIMTIELNNIKEREDVNNQKSNKKIKAKRKREKTNRANFAREEEYNQNLNKINFVQETKTDNKKSNKTETRENKEKNGQRKQYNKNEEKNRQRKQHNKNNEEKQYKKKKKKSKKIKIFISLILLIIALIIFALVSPIFNIQEIVVYGNETISTETILSLSGLQTGKNIFQNISSDIISKIKENTYIDDVTIKKILPGTIEITVEEREVAYQVNVINSYVYLDYKGYILETSSEKADVPILSGLSTSQDTLLNGQRLEGDDITRLNAILKIVNNAKEFEIYDLITEIIVEENEYVLYLKSEKKYVYLGDDSNITNKMMFAEIIIENEKGNEGYVMINGDLDDGFDPYFREEDID